MSTVPFPPVIQKIHRCGQSLSIYLPQKLVERWALRAGDIVALRVDEGKLIAQRVDLSDLAKLRAQRS